MKVEKNFDEALIKYNANSNNKDTGDCARRAISLAYDLPYNDVKRDLFKFSKSIGHANDDTDAIDLFIDKLGYQKKERFNKSDHYKVEQFCEEHPTGTYLVDCISDRSTMVSHLVCVIDGDVYDSWDSRYMNVTDVWTIKEDKGKERNTDNTDLKQYITDRASELLNQLNKDGTYAYIGSSEDNLTYSIMVRVPLTEGEEKMSNYIYKQSRTEVKKYDICTAKNDITKRWYFWSNKHYIKFTPFDDNDVKLKKCDEACVKAFKDVMSKADKLYKDFYKIMETNTSKNPKFTGNKNLLTKMPKDAIPYIVGLYKDVDKEEGYTYTDYTLYMEPIPEDKNRDEFVAHTSSLITLRRYIKEYMTTLERNTEW